MKQFIIHQNNSLKLSTSKEKPFKEENESEALFLLYIISSAFKNYYSRFYSRVTKHL